MPLLVLVATFLNAGYKLFHCFDNYYLKKYVIILMFDSNKNMCLHINSFLRY